jgi:hypothetical protein
MFKPQLYFWYILFILALSVHIVAAQKLAVFMISEYKPITVENALKAEYPSWSIQVYSDIADFKQGIAIDTPEVIITKPLVLEQLPHYTIVFKAITNGSSTESYALLSKDPAPIIPLQLQKKPVGVIDYLGKVKMQYLVETALSVSPELIRVKKWADLLPLLTMDMATCIFISEHTVPYVTSHSKQTFTITRCNGEFEIGIIGVNSHTPIGIGKKIQSMPPTVSRLLGVDSWR